MPNRGVIRDRNGVVLAQSYSAYTLEIQPARVKNLEQTIDALAEIVDIQPRDRKRFRKLLDESKNFESLPLRTRLTDDEVARFAVNRYRFPGVEIKARLFRQYPYGEIASHVVGYIGRINDRDLARIDEWDESANYKGSDYIGKVGIELSYERELHGTTGVEEVEVDAGGRAVRTLSRTPPASGNDLALSLDIKLQEVAEAAFGDRRGALVAIDPATGDVLAFVSKPGFDPNLFVDGIDSANWELLNESPDKPLLNRPLRGAYPPGSTIKPFLALARAHVRQAHADADDLRSRASSSCPAPRTASATTSPAATAPSTCTSRSSRPATPTTTCWRARPTSTTPHRFLSQLGFGRKTGIDIEGELTGVLPSREWKRQRFAGQEVPRGASQVVPRRQHLRRHRAGLQRVHADAARARDRDDRQRRRRVPAAPRASTIRDVGDRRGARGRAASRRTRSPLKPEHLAVIKNALVGVSKEGTSAARVRQGARTSSAGKTGTAQVYSLKGEKYIAQQGRRAAARPRVVHRLRAGRQAADRARRAGRERRLRRAGGGADRAAGVRLLPARRDEGGTGAGRRRSPDAEDESD